MSAARRGAAALILLLLAPACASEPAPDATPEPTVAAPPREPTPAATAPEPSDTGPRLLVDAIGLSPLYEGFARDPEALTNLSRRLGSVVDAPFVTVVASWDEADLSGTFTLLVPDDYAATAAMADAITASTAVDPTPLHPLLASLGAYRAELGERFDLRLVSFGIRLGMWDRETGSRCYAPGAPQDPDGNRLAGCFVCAHPRTGEGEVCFDGAAPATLRGPKNLTRMLASSLRPQAAARDSRRPPGGESTPSP